MHKTRIGSRNEKHKILWHFEIQTGYFIWARKPDLVWINKKKRTFSQVDFAILADQKAEMKESEKIEKDLDFARELRKL